MNQKSMEITGVILLVILILIPFGLILISQEPAGPFTRDTSLKEIRDLVTKSGVVLCSERENTWDVPGAQGGMTYTFRENCSIVDKHPDVIIHVQKFNTEENRNAAIHGFNSQIKGKSNGVLLTHGPYVILVQGPLHGKVAAKIKKQIKLL